MFDCIRNLLFSSSSVFDINYIEHDIILTPKDGHFSTLIFMHGLGDSSSGYLGTFTNSARPIPDRTKVVLLTAPKAKVTINGGAKSFSWYDIKGFQGESDISQVDIKENSKRVMEVIDKEAALLQNNYSRIFIGGFSQGATMALHIGLNAPKLIGGIIALSGVLFPFSTLTINKEEKKDLPIYLGHGTEDPLLNINLVRQSYDYFDKEKYSDVTFKEFEMDHTINTEELIDMKDFIQTNSVKGII